MKVFLASLAIVAAGLMAAAPAADASLLFNLTSNHCTVPADCGAPNTIFGTVTLTQIDSDTVDFDVHLFSPYAFAKTGSADFQSFKFNAINVLVAGDVTITQNAPKPLAFAAGAFNGDGTGTFGFAIGCPTCGNGLSDGFNTDIIFTIDNAVISDFTNPNNLGNVFVADVGNTINGATGPIDASGGGVGGSTIPEPATLLLLGSGLLGLGLRGRVRSLLQN